MKHPITRSTEFLARNVPLSVRWSEEDEAFVGSIPGLVGECCHGDSPEEVISQLKDIAADLVEYLAASHPQAVRDALAGRRGG